jgi:short-subunit dehydrogenase
MQREIVVITGASAGVGRATAREFAKHGASVALLARGEGGLEAAADEVEQLGGRALVIPTDVSEPDQVQSGALAVEQMLGPIDIWVNNAMASVFSPAMQMEPSEFRRVTEVTYLGVVYGTLAALHHMSQRNRGSIVQVGSALAYRSIPLQSAYCGAKHGIRGFTESLRSELLHDHIDVHLTMVQLPALNTPQFEWAKSRLPRRPQPVPPIFQPEVAARAIYWAAHSRRRELVVGFPVWKAITAEKLIPEWLDKFLARTGCDAQQTDEPDSHNRANNLWQPLPDDYGAHGRFDAHAKSWSAYAWASRHRGWLGLGLVAAVGLAATIRLWSSTQSSSAPGRTDLRLQPSSPARVAR